MTRSAQQRAAINERRLMASMDYSAQSRRRYQAAARAWGVGTELKAIDTDLSWDNVSTTDRLECINLCTAGADIGNRVGREITMRSVQLRGYIVGNGAAPAGLVFWAIVYDRQSNGAAPSWEDIYTADTLEPQFRNLDNRKRFKVLGSSYVQVPSTSSLETKQVPIEFYRKMRHPVEYNSTNGGTIADIQTGALWFMIRASEAVGDNDYSIEAWTRVRFTDM